LTLPSAEMSAAQAGPWTTSRGAREYPGHVTLADLHVASAQQGAFALHPEESNSAWVGKGFPHGSKSPPRYVLPKALFALAVKTQSEPAAVHSSAVIANGASSAQLLALRAHGTRIRNELRNAELARPTYLAASRSSSAASAKVWHTES